MKREAQHLGRKRAREKKEDQDIDYRFIEEGPQKKRRSGTRVTYIFNT